jgi:hypothetical protein
MASSFVALRSDLTFPGIEQALDVMTLLVGELELAEAPAGLRGVVVGDRGLEPFAQRRRLGELPAEPAQQSDGIRPVGHSFFT